MKKKKHKHDSFREQEKREKNETKILPNCPPSLCQREKKMSSVCSFSLSFVVQICKKFARGISRNSYGDYPSIVLATCMAIFYHLFNFFNIETEITSYSLTTAPESCLEDSPMILNSMLWPRTDFYLVPERDSVGPLRSGVIR